MKDQQILALLVSTTAIEGHTRYAFRIADIVENDILNDAFNSGNGDCYLHDPNTLGDPWKPVYSVIGDIDDYWADDEMVSDETLVWTEGGRWANLP